MNVHGVTRQCANYVVGIGVTNMRFALRSGAQLQIIAQRATGPPALPADQSLDRATMHVMRTGADWRSKNNAAWIVPVDRLDHQNRPKTIHRVGSGNVFSSGRRIEHIWTRPG